VSLVVRGAGGTITVPDAVLVQIAARAAEGVGGVRVKRRRSVDLETATVKLGVSARRGEPLLVAGELVQEHVATAFQGMCGLDLTVNLSIEELA
jgi:uncharacterized alkaline shock family protein YloU